MHKLEIELDERGTGSVKVDGQNIECSRVEITCNAGDPVTAILTIPRVLLKLKAEKAGVAQVIVE